jgi:hypothetical protein
MLANMPIQWVKFFSSYEISNSLSVYAHRELVPILKMLFIPFNLFISLTLPAIFFSWKKVGVLFAATAILGYASSISVFDMLYRYRIPVVPLLCCLAGYGLTLLLSRRLCRIRRTAVFFAIIIIFILTYRSPDRLRPHSERMSVAAIMISLDQLAQAEDYIERMSKDGIDTQKLRNLLQQAKTR